MKRVYLSMRIVFVLSLLCLLMGNLEASTLLTSDVGYTGPTLDLSGQANGQYNFTFGPVSLPGGITFVASPGGGPYAAPYTASGYPYGGNSGQGSVLGQGLYNLDANGSFGGNAVYAGVDSGTGYMDFRLSAPASEFGLYMNYAVHSDGSVYGGDPIISTLDSLSNVISYFDLSTLAPISTPGGFNAFVFRGIQDTSADIYGLRLGGSYLLAAATSTGAPTVPEPSTMLLLGAGLAGVGIMRRRYKK